MGFPAQFGLLAQEGLGDWANILFILAMAILWLLAGLVKTIGKKGPAQRSPESEGSPGRQGRQAESWQQRLARRAQELQRRLEQEAGMREPGKSEPPAPRPASAPGGKITVRTDARGESIMVYERPQPQPPAQREPPAKRRRQVILTGAQPSVTPAFEPIRRETPQLAAESLLPMMAESPQPPESPETRLAAPHKPTGFEPEAIIDYTDPDALKKAILHYEILGRPIALRDTPDQTSPF